MLTKRHIQSIDFIRFIFIFSSVSIVLIFYGLVSAADSTVEEEYLPQVMTVTEMERRLQITEENIQHSDLNLVLADLSDLRREIEQQRAEFSTGDASVLQRLLKIEDMVDMVEGSIYFYHDNQKSARQAFVNLIKRSPSATLDGNVATPKLAQYFENLREQMVGYLTMDSDPVGADVYIGDQLIGQTPLISAYALAGEISIQISHRGFESTTTSATIKAGQETKLSVSLVKTSGSCILFTSPPGVTVLLDEIEQGTTSGVLPDEYAYLATDQSLKPEEVSAPFLIDYIELGKHELGFSKPCHRAVKSKITVELGQFILPPIKLETAFGKLSVDSEPPGLSVTLDQQNIGVAPLKLDNVCPGSHVLRVDMDSHSGWFEMIDVAENEMTMVHARPRPTLLFLGCASKDRSLVSEGTIRIENWLRSQGWFNMASLSEQNRYRIKPEVLKLLEQVTDYSSSSIPWDQMMESLPVSLGESKANLYAIALLTAPGSLRPGALFFIHPSHTSPDIIELPEGMPPIDMSANIQETIGRSMAISELWFGIKLIERTDGLLIIDIDPKGPAMNSNLRVGDRIIGIGDSPVKTIDDFHSVSRDIRTPVQLTLIAQRGSESITSSITGKRLPRMLALSDPDVLYNLQLARLEEMSVFPEIESAVRLNMGICQLALGNPKLAIDDGFSRCTLESNVGVNQGTLNYLKAIAAHRAGYAEEAKRYLLEAGKDTDATLLDINGPFVAPLADFGLR